MIKCWNVEICKFDNFLIRILSRRSGWFGRKLESKFVVGFALLCVVLHHIVSDEFVLNQGWIFEWTLFCRMPWVWMLVVAKKTLVLFLSGSHWWWFVDNVILFFLISFRVDVMF